MLNLSTIAFKWQWIEEIPSRIETLENYQLDELLKYADHLMQKVQSDKANLALLNSWETVKAIRFNDEKEAEEISKAVHKEKERRRQTVEQQGKLIETFLALRPTDKAVQSPVEDERPLFPFFHGSDKLDLALKAAKEAGILNDAGKWAHDGYKTNALSVWWRAAVTAELAKPGAPIYKVSQAASKQFSENFGQNAIDQKKEIADFGERYKRVYALLLATMRP